MNWLRKSARPWVGLVVAAHLTMTASARAQDGAEELKNWPHFVEVLGQGRDPIKVFNEKYYVFTLPPVVLGKAQAELGDLRLVDANGLRVPYARRVLRPRHDVQTLDAELFDRGTNSARGYAQVSLQLAPKKPLEHNEIEIFTAGKNFRRRVIVYASNNYKFPEDDTFEVENGHIFHHDDPETGILQVRKLKYPVQKARYLRVRVYRDFEGDEDRFPTIEKVLVRQTVAVSGVDQTLPATLEPREPTRTDLGPGSAWFVHLGEDAVPLERLTFTVNGEPVQRPFRLETANPDEPRQPVNAQWQWRKAEKKVQLEAEFPEMRARRLRLVVTDYANPPLDLQGVAYTARVRQIVFAPPAGKKVTAPLKLYFGNAQATPAEYDFERNLPGEVTPAPVVLEVTERQDNPTYEPPPRPLGERLPWLVYVVLGLACVVLVVLLGMLARQAVRRHDAKVAGEKV